jgi:hypothetical protein
MTQVLTNNNYQFAKPGSPVLIQVTGSLLIFDRHRYGGNIQDLGLFILSFYLGSLYHEEVTCW